MKILFAFCIALFNTITVAQAQSTIAQATDAEVKTCIRSNVAARKVLGRSFSVSEWVLKLEKITTNEALRNSPLTVEEVLEEQKSVEALYAMLGKCPALDKISKPITNIRNALKKSIVTEKVTQKTKNNNSLFGEDTHTITRTKVVGSFKTIKTKRREIRKMKRTLKLR